jgi:hypothetical protein
VGGSQESLNGASTFSALPRFGATTINVSWSRWLESTLTVDIDAGEVEGIVAKFEGLTTEVGGDAVATEGEGGGFGDLALIAVEEGLAKIGGVQGPGGGGGVLAIAFEGGWAVSA